MVNTRASRREEEHTKDSRVDLGNAFVPGLAPHVGTPASASIQTVFGRELANIEAEPVRITQCWDRDRVCWGLLGKE